MSTISESGAGFVPERVTNPLYVARPRIGASHSGSCDPGHGRLPSLDQLDVLTEKRTLLSECSTLTRWNSIDAQYCTYKLERESFRDSGPPDCGIRPVLPFGKRRLFFRCDGGTTPSPHNPWAPKFAMAECNLSTVEPGHTALRLRLLF